METKRQIEKIDETRSWFFEKINKIDKTLARLTKRNREKAQINKIRNEREVHFSYNRYHRNTKNYETTMNSYTPTNWTV